jgi:hypothetical protein
MGVGGQDRILRNLQEAGSTSMKTRQVWKRFQLLTALFMAMVLFAHAFVLVSCLSYSLILKMEATYSPKYWWTFNRRCYIMFQERELIKITEGCFFRQL